MARRMYIALVLGISMIMLAHLAYSGPVQMVYAKNSKECSKSKQKKNACKKKRITMTQNMVNVYPQQMNAGGSSRGYSNFTQRYVTDAYYGSMGGYRGGYGSSGYGGYYPEYGLSYASGGGYGYSYPGAYYAGGSVDQYTPYGYGSYDSQYGYDAPYTYVSDSADPYAYLGNYDQYSGAYPVDYSYSQGIEYLDPVSVSGDMYSEIPYDTSATYYEEPSYDYSYPQYAPDSLSYDSGVYPGYDFAGY